MNGLRGKPSLESLLGLLLEHTLIMLRRLIWLAELKHATRPTSRRFLSVKLGAVPCVAVTVIAMFVPGSD
jgi:hypothetical protein